MTRWLVAVMSTAGGLLLPGYLTPHYSLGDKIPIEVGKLWSARSQVPYSYYQMDVCKPSDLGTRRGGFGSVLLGDVIENTPYEVHYMETKDCAMVCEKQLTKESIEDYKRKVDDEYYVNLYADGLQGNIRMSAMDYLRYYEALRYWHVDLLPDNVINPEHPESVLVVGGYPVGLRTTLGLSDHGGNEIKGNDSYLIFNHVDLLVKFNKNQVVEFEVTPRSIKWPSINDACSMSGSSSHGVVDISKMQPGESIFYTYTVRHGRSLIEYGTRWDAYMTAVSGPSQIHTMGIMNGINLVILLTIVTSSIMLRTLKRDFSMYNSPPETSAALADASGNRTGAMDIESLRAETGWKLLHGDIFRKPRFAKLLACAVGTGVQLSCMMFFTLTLIHLGFVNPTRRGLVIQTAIIIYFMLGIPAGYFSARFNRLLQPNYQNTLLVTLYTAFQYSGICISGMLLMNFVLLWKGSIGVLPLKYIIVLLALWLFVCVPLVFVGSFIGYRQPDFELPCQTNLIPRLIPTNRPLYSRAYVLCPIGGCILITSVFGELLMIINSIWQHKLYYLFGVLFIVASLIFVTSSLISVISTYINISAGNYKWWWISFWSTGTSGGYFVLLSLIYYWKILDIADFASKFLYWTYTALAAYTITLITGSIGVLSSFMFLRTIYGAIKVA